MPRSIHRYYIEESRYANISRLVAVKTLDGPVAGLLLHRGVCLKQMPLAEAEPPAIVCATSNDSPADRNFVMWVATQAPAETYGTAKAVLYTGRATKCSWGDADSRRACMATSTTCGFCC